MNWKNPENVFFLQISKLSLQNYFLSCRYIFSKLDNKEKSDLMKESIIEICVEKSEILDLYYFCSKKLKIVGFYIVPNYLEIDEKHMIIK